MGLFPKAENFVSFMATHRCARPWWVYVETFVPAYLELFLTLVFLDLEDLIRDYAKDLVKQPGSGRAGSGKHFRKPAYQSHPTALQRWSQKGLKTLLVITEPLEKIGFAWLVYGASEQFFYRWQSLLMQSAYCTAPLDTGPFSRQRGPGLFISILPEGAATPLPILQQDRAGWGSTGFSVDLPPGLYRGIYAVSISGPPGGLTGVNARLRISGTFGDTLIDGPMGDVGEGQSADFLVNATFFLPILLGGGKMGWELRGPAVPAGVLCNGAMAICSLTQ